jgi:hypothetical protein
VPECILPMMQTQGNCTTFPSLLLILVVFSAKYSYPGASGSQFLVASNVALGSVKKYFTIQSDLVAPPQVYSSTTYPYSHIL